MKRSMSTMTESQWLLFEDTMMHRKVFGPQYIDQSLVLRLLHPLRVPKTNTILQLTSSQSGGTGVVTSYRNA